MGNITWRKTLCGAVTGFAGWVAAAHGQDAAGMNGRAIDASNQVGALGLNTPVSHSFMNSANLYMTGNASAGRSFRGYSPIRSTSSMYLGLPSAGMGYFGRDSIGLNDVLAGRSQAVANPFYVPGVTVAGLSAIRSGANIPGTSLPRSPADLPQAGYPSAPQTGAANVAYGMPNVNPVVPNSSVYTPGNTPLLRDWYDQMALPAQVEALRQPPAYGRTVAQTSSFGSIAPQPQPTGLEDPYALPTAPLIGRTLDPLVRQSRTTVPSRGGSAPALKETDYLLAPERMAPRLLNQNVADIERSTLPGGVSVSELVRSGQSGALVPGPLAAIPTAAGATGGELPGGTAPIGWRDVERAATLPLREVGGQSANPLFDLAVAVSWLERRQAGTQVAEAETAGSAEREAQAVAVVQAVSAETARTLAGKEKSRANDFVVRAEEHVRKGDYYRAAGLYGLAAAYDPTNPLVRLGHGHALLAAGEYITAVHQITGAIEDYPGFGYLQLDLSAFIADLNLLDVRRADLEAKLELQEDYRLRFLLGYIEYYTGLAKFGLPNLQRAAADAPAGSVIARMPEILAIDARLGVKSRSAPAKE